MTVLLFRHMGYGRPASLFFTSKSIVLRDNGLDWTGKSRNGRSKSLCVQCYFVTLTIIMTSSTMKTLFETCTQKKTTSRSKFVTIEIVCLVSLTISSTAQKLLRVIIIKKHVFPKIDQPILFQTRNDHGRFGATGLKVGSRLTE